MMLDRVGCWSAAQNRAHNLHRNEVLHRNAQNLHRNAKSCTETPALHRNGSVARPERSEGPNLAS
jgi:hypothetical protein